MVILITLLLNKSLVNVSARHIHQNLMCIYVTIGSGTVRDGTNTGTLFKRILD